MCMPWSHISPSRARAYASVMLICPVRTLLISVPVRTSPASTCSRNSYSKRARRLSTRDSGAGFPADTDFAEKFALGQLPLDDEAALAAGKFVAVRQRDA